MAPVLLAVVPILALWAGNFLETTPAEAVPPLLAAAATGLIAWLAARRGLRSAAAASLLASAAVVALWLWSPLAGGLVPWLGDGRAAGAVAGALLVLALTGLAWALPRSSHAYLSTGVLVTACVLFAFSAIRLAAAFAAMPRDAAPPEVAPVVEAAQAAADDPDIYWIVLDAFGRSDVLRRTYGLEEGLAEALARLGFYVAERSAANYTTTLHSIPATLNLDYVQSLIPAPQPTAAPLLGLVRDSALVRRLRLRGYTWIAYSSGYASTDVKGADLVIAPPAPLSEWQAHLVERSPLGWLGDDLPWSSPYRAHRRRILHALETLPDVARDPRPTFTFVHLLSPHHPFVFGEDGEDVSRSDRPFRFNDGGTGGRPTPPGEVNQEYVRGYRAQARFLGRRVAETVAEILAASPRPPILVIQGDHGPNSHWPGMDPAERLPILNALYLPGGGAARLYPEISPVNTFRVILASYFGEPLELLPDEHYVSSYEHPYRFQRVSLEAAK
jgi:hypothetical protein